MEGAAATVMERCDILGRISEEPGRITRPYGSEAMRQVNDVVAGWMRASGMTVRQDAIGNLVGRYEGMGDKTLILGSHLDTVRDAGKYDGILGMMVALTCLERLHERGERLPFAIEVVGFADEEGLRFGTTYLGSSVFAGAFNPKLLSLKDANGVTLADAVCSFGGDPDGLVGNGRNAGELIGYCEVHIEQGPRLETHDLPIGIVSGIAGQSRIVVGFEGKADHAGTVPMEGRRDALCAAAEFVVEVEATARGEPGLVATVGEISVQPGASNVIPGEVDLSLDIRHQDDEVREQACQALRQRVEEIGAAREVVPRWHLRQEKRAVTFAPDLTALFEQAVGELGYPVERLPSGAGHDAAQMADLGPVAMLFVRCREGISHNPAESVRPEDVAVAIEVVNRFLELVAK